MDTRLAWPGAAPDQLMNLAVERKSQVCLWFCNAGQVTQRGQEIETVLSAAERARARRFAFPHLRWRYALGRALLRQILGEQLGKDPASIDIKVRSGGKPFVDDALYFNSSGSGDWLLIGLSKDSEIGVDIELLKDVDEMDALVSRYFSPKEGTEIRSAPETIRQRMFFRGWSRKEAVSKALGLGLAMDFGGFSVSLDDIHACTRVDLSGTRQSGADSFMRPVSLVEEGESAVACDFPIDISGVYRVGPNLEWIDVSH